MAAVAAISQSPQFGSEQQIGSYIQRHSPILGFDLQRRGILEIVARHFQHRPH